MLKLKPARRVRDYELTILNPGDFTSTELKKSLEAVNALVKKVGGEVKETTDWGKRELAYLVKKQGKTYREAVYTFIQLSLDSSKVSELEHQLLLDQNIIRHLLVVADETVFTPFTDDTKRNS